MFLTEYSYIFLISSKLFASPYNGKQCLLKFYKYFGIPPNPYIGTLLSLS